ncbi:DNA-directed RNA polymerase subunit beta [Bacillus sp. OV166]|uniref:DNA-directed RNA polymerase subunit beta n=1 Tax=Bacillus sp. OV166 TaxID=1882763 RepID=UPI000A2AA703|nr:DNA-directed RNA polymerase subunit beta [Bacillus sp. OV166]SMQ85166.1 DNA-directed RNA polymerase subunit beta [Bacillus sp. OV166]
MSVNNSNHEQYRTREDYKHAKAEELQRKKDVEKQARDEVRQIKDAEKQAKDEARQIKDAEKRAKDEARQIKDAEKQAKDEAQQTKVVEKQAPTKIVEILVKNVAGRLKGLKKPTLSIARKTQDAGQQAKTKQLRQKSETPGVKETKTSPTREAQRSKESNTTNSAGKNAETEPVSYQLIRIRLIPIWLRLVLLVVMAIFCVTAGAVVGYGLLGGGKVAEVFQESTWTHIIDLVQKGK